MKYLANILIAGAAIFALASCSHVAPYTGEDFVAFSNSSYKVAESAGSYKIPVNAYPQSGNANTSVSFKVVEGTAKAGTNFTVEPASGVLTFAGDSTQYITVNVIDQDGVYTGDLGFSIEITSTTNDYRFPNYNTANVTIQDEDHPLLALFGEYTMKAVSNSSSGYGYYSWEMNISPYEGDVTRIWLDVIAPFFSTYRTYAPEAAMYGIVSEDKSTITIPYPQSTVSTAKDAFSIDENYVLYQFDGHNLDASFLTAPGNIVFTLQGDGSYQTLDSYGFATPSYVGEGWFYYYMNVFGGFNANYPAFFKKN